MSPTLAAVFEELSITQYLAHFIDQGFDSWETILDITESDLDALGVKLGHRRKLQRRIANDRGLAPQTKAVSLRRSSSGDSCRAQHVAREVSASSKDAQDGSSATSQKRKYRRHPKADENAPDRPPSAYVLFSNKMREDLKTQNLTFTEIAKLVGENWQNVTLEDKAPFENLAQTAKDKYNRDLLEYKKTGDFRKYNTYLLDFKAKHNLPRPDKDAPKRIKLSRTNLAQHSSSSGAQPRELYRTESTSDAESPPVTSPRRRLNPSVSTSQMQRSMSKSSAITDSTRYCSLRHSSSQPDPASSSDSIPIGASQIDRVGASHHLPPIADVVAEAVDSRSMTNVSGFPFDNYAATRYSRPSPSISSIESRVPSLRQHSSAESGSSRNSVAYPLTPVETALPIHALVNNTKPMAVDYSMAGVTGYRPTRRTPSPDSIYSGTPLHRGCSIPEAASTPYSAIPLRSYPSDAISVSGLSIAPATSPVTNVLPPISAMAPLVAPPSSARLPLKYSHRRPVSEAGFDGVAALLQAGEMVNRQTR